MALIISAMSVSFVVGCSTEEEAPPPQADDDLRGGALATAKIYDAIGMLGR